jgi:hypothetical protein
MTELNKKRDYLRIISTTLIFLLSFLNFSFNLYLCLIVLFLEIIIIHRVYNSNSLLKKEVQYHSLKYTIQIFICSIISYSIIGEINHQLILTRYGLLQYTLFLTTSYNWIFLVFLSKKK